MNKIPVSVFIIAQDEEKHIGRVLDSCQQFDEVIVVDSGSTDQTKTIAHDKGAKVIHNDWPGYAKQKQYAKDLCRNEWVLNLDADEELTSELIEEIKTFINQKHDFVALKCRRNDLFINKFFSRLTRLPTNIRLFKKSCVEYYVNNLVHEGPGINGKLKHTNKYFNHYGYADIHQLTEKYNKYSTLKAEEKFQRGKRFSLFKLLLIYPFEFLRHYFIYRYCFSGVRGFIFSHLSAYYALSKEMKLYEFNKKS